MEKIFCTLVHFSQPFSFKSVHSPTFPTQIYWKYSFLWCFVIPKSEIHISVLEGGWVLFKKVSWVPRRIFAKRNTVKASCPTTISEIATNSWEIHNTCSLATEKSLCSCVPREPMNWKTFILYFFCIFYHDFSFDQEDGHNVCMNENMKNETHLST